MTQVDETPRALDDVAQINAAYPDLAIHSVRPLATASEHNKVIINNDHLVFRFPRNAEIARSMLAEVRLLQAIKGRVTLPIPDPVYVHLSPQADRVLFMGYERLSGEPMTYNTLEGQPEAVLKPLAKQLAALHTVPLASLESNLPVDGTRAGWRSLFEAIREKLYPFMRLEAQTQVTANFETALNDPNFWQFEPRLCHGDFGTGNILYDPVSYRATGILDFSLCGPGDPAQDVGAVWSLGDDFMPHFLDYYPEMRATLSRVKFIRGTYGLQQALHGLQIGDAAEFKDGMGKYR